MINSVFLYHAVQAGLDCVILNPKDIIPYHMLKSDHKDSAEDLIFNKKPDALASLLSTCVASDHVGRATTAPVIDAQWPASKRINKRIINRIREDIEADVVLAIADNIESPIMSKDGSSNDSLLPAMKTVGDKFGSGEIILPFVLQSAECMKAAVSEVEKYLVKKEGVSKGKLVLGTVYGDVHDIGKNLVKTIFQNNGYTVHDLGKQVPMQTFLDKIKEVNADAVGLLLQGYVRWTKDYG